MSTPFSIAGALNLPGDSSLPQQPIPFNGSNNYESKMEGELTFTGAGTKAVPFGTVARAKGFVFRVEQTTGAQPILITTNGGVETKELSAGGFWIWYDPSSATGITGISFSHTAAGKVSFWILG